MDTFQLILLALIQGVTEWLPISSSAHLILFPSLTGQADQGPLIDAMAHLGSLGAVLVYFNRDIARMLQGATDLILGRERDGLRLTPDSKRLLLIAIATPPGLLVGFVLDAAGVLEQLRQPAIIAAASIGFGVLLWLFDTDNANGPTPILIRFAAGMACAAASIFALTLVDELPFMIFMILVAIFTLVGLAVAMWSIDAWTHRAAPRAKQRHSFTYRDAIIIGLTQMLAFIPGVSRSGVTMTAARALGFARDEAARFGMLVGIPLIGAVGLYALFQLVMGESPNAVAADGSEIPVTVFDGLVVAVLSFASAWASVAILMQLVKRTGFFPFVLYRIGLGLFLIVYAHGL